MPRSHDRDSGVEIGYDVNAWNEMAEMGWAGVIIPEEYGGSAFGYLSMGLILEELGRTLTASPLIASGVGAARASTAWRFQTAGSVSSASISRLSRSPKR